ncbi:hypothetical protein BB560_003596 [Smittium megazygosporum]|uniref:SHSP domain-containing protein n=1 Tax=Smittium megazygosporum TaxID=133381 RepID=A0A2T9ZBN7_9FUNG|nr:hypothetical protein BB560_003596 [Smittium megazygosporum]
MSDNSNNSDNKNQVARADPFEVDIASPNFFDRFFDPLFPDHWSLARRQMNAMLSEPRSVAAQLLGSGRGGTCLWSPSVDIKESNDMMTLNAEIPGVPKDDIKMQVVNNRLVISGEKSQENIVEDQYTHRTERCYGKFERSFLLPKTAETEKISAKYENGVLKVTIPKKAESSTNSRLITIE